MHLPVLQNQILTYLQPKSNENFIDCTIGEGGHSLAILKNNSPKGRLLGIDWDEKMIKNLEVKTKNFGERIILVCDNFANLKKIVEKVKFGQADGILFDLGMSSWHLEESGRGFSFLKNEPLDMRYNVKLQIQNCKSQITAEKIVNEWPKDKIEKILKEYGEEKYARQITEEIIKTRKIRRIKTTKELVNVIQKAVPLKYQKQKIHFATKTFQALRIAVNQELENLKIALPQTIEVLKPGGRIVVISFHSLEDRIVKNFFREKSKEKILKIITKKPITPSRDEIKINPRSRSAKLRAAILCPINL